MTTEPQPDANGQPARSSRRSPMSMAGATARCPSTRSAHYVRRSTACSDRLRNPSPELLGKVVSELGACDKNQEEMLEPHRRPKIIDYGNMVLIVAITVEVEAERPIFGETPVPGSATAFVTVRRGATAGHSLLRERLKPRRICSSAAATTSRPSCSTGWWTASAAAAAKIESVVEGAEQKLLIRGAKDSGYPQAVPPAPRPLRIHTGRRRWPRFAAAWRGSR